MHSHYTFVRAIHAVDPNSMGMYIERDQFMLLSTLTLVTLVTIYPLSCWGTLVLASHDIDTDLPLFIEMYKATVFVVLKYPMKIFPANVHRFSNIYRMLTSIRVVPLGGTVFQKHLREETTELFSEKQLLNTHGMIESFEPVAASEPCTEFYRLRCAKLWHQSQDQGQRTMYWSWWSWRAAMARPSNGVGLLETRIWWFYATGDVDWLKIASQLLDVKSTSSFASKSLLHPRKSKMPC